MESNYERIDLRVDLEAVQAGKARAQQLITGVRGAGRALLTEAESKELLKAHEMQILYIGWF